MDSRHVSTGREYRRKERRRRRRKKVFAPVFELLVLGALGFIGYRYFCHRDRLEIAENIEIPEWIDVQYIDEGNPSRTGWRLDGVNNIVIHYVGNPGTTAQQNRDYYNHEDSNVCSHFVVGLDGGIILCVPLYERSAASNHRNHDTISIEVCHPDESGKFTDASYASLVKLTDWLLHEFDMKPQDVIRHYDVTGKECPMYYVKNPEAWEKFKEEL
ncbi:N-acetylmuramoyl-L-alanine amidase family protein [Pseudobutyrivibrio xylanivorans]|uniref:N-acetylmuramoyl-L-alanine amidase n=1 Tax=Pseudobutyrivibrio xylanivorans TaxID=185007 RepID=A0A5P6VS85_PSEXY|nr:peptidoglycan recognition family protein [Pseudobutyrivibrio xylanivorans]QFJ55446.1 N-acetylmuramoyl-L-alanine amidase [Pseudobutyrivibrio xylanivorans]